MFLSPTELEELTGYRRPGAQLAWLSDHGYMHDTNAAGIPVVAKAEVERHLVGGGVAKAVGPDLSSWLPKPDGATP